MLKTEKLRNRAQALRPYSKLTDIVEAQALRPVSTLYQTQLK